MVNVEEIQKIPKAQLQILAERELSKRSFYEFFLLCMKNIYTHIEFENNWHYKAVFDIIQERTFTMLRHEKGQNLLINEPTRCLKSVSISEIYPVWLEIISNGTLQIQNVCATQRLATKSSRMSKLIITSDWFRQRFPEIQIVQDNRSKSDYSFTNGGARISFGVDSSIIGSNFDVLIIDDINDPTEKNSDIAIRNVTETFQDVIAGRQNREWGLKIILQQRTSDKDLCGFLLENNKNEYRHICLPAELTKDCSPEFVRYYQDGLFFPKLYSRERLADIKKEKTMQGYFSQMLQSPTALEGNIIKRLFFKNILESEFLKRRAEHNKAMLFLDTAFGDNPNNDPSCLFLCTEIDKIIYVLKCENFPLEFNDLLNEILEWIKIYNIKKIYIENKSSGASISQELRRILRIRGSKATVLTINPGAKSKTERAQASQPYLVNGQVILVGNGWEEFLNQCANFPYGRHDDMVDCLTYSILTLIAGKKMTEELPQTTDTRGMFSSEAEIENLYD